METTNQNNVDEIISQSTDEIKEQAENKPEIVLIDVEKLHPHDANPRKDVGDVTELADSIKKNGILQNLTVVPCGGYWYGDYTVIIGHRRLAAAKMAGLGKVPCVIRQMDEKEQISTMLLENMQRSDLTPYEQAQGIQMMLDLGETVATVSEKTGFSQSTIRRRTRLLQLDMNTFKETEGRQVTMQEYDKLFEIDDEKKRNEVLKHIGTNNFNSKWQQVVSEEQQQKQRNDFLLKLDEVAEKVEISKDLRWVGYIHNMESVENYISSAPEGVEFYYEEHKWGIELYRSYTSEEWAEVKQRRADSAANEKRKKNNEKRIIRLKELSKRNFELRKSFVKECTGLKSHMKDIMEFTLIGMVRDYFDEFDIEMFAEMMDVELPEDEEITFELFEEQFRSNPERTLFIAAYCDSDDGPNASYNNYFGDYQENENLDGIYDMLTRFGYELSDEEKMWRDGTHELYTEVEVKSDEENED